MYALDSNVIIHFFKGKGRVAENLLSHGPKDLFIPSIVYYELQHGLRRAYDPAHKKVMMDMLLEKMTFLEFGPEEARIAADIRYSLECEGKTIGAYNILIAATALSRNMTLVTNNTKEFSRVPSLNITDWL